MPRTNKKRKKQSFGRRLNRLWLRYEYKHTTAAVLVMGVFVLLVNTAVAAWVFEVIKNLGDAGAVLVGVLSVSFFTAGPAAAALVTLAPETDIVRLALLAGFGAVIGDWLLLLFFEERVAHELRPIFKRTGLAKTVGVLQRYRSTRWILLVFGALVISTPLPDEIGIAMMGISHFRRVGLLVVCFALNTLGIFALLLAARAVLA